MPIDYKNLSFPKVTVPKKKVAGSSSQKTSTTKKSSSTLKTSSIGNLKVAGTNSNLLPYLGTNKDGTQSLSLPTKDNDFLGALVSESNMKKPSQKENIVGRGFDLLQIADVGDLIGEAIYPIIWGDYKSKYYEQNNQPIQAKIQKVPIVGGPINSIVDKLETVITGKKSESHTSQAGTAYKMKLEQDLKTAKEKGQTVTANRIQREIDEVPEMLLNIATIPALNQVAKSLKIDNLLDISKIMPDRTLPVQINSNTKSISSILESGLPKIYDTDLNSALAQFGKEMNLPDNVTPTLKNISNHIVQNTKYNDVSENFLKLYKNQESIKPGSKVDSKTLKQHLKNATKSVPDSTININVTEKALPEIMKVSQDYDKALDSAIKSGDKETFTNLLFHPKQQRVRDLLNSQTDYLANVGRNYTQKSLEKLGFDDDQLATAKQAQSPLTYAKDKTRAVVDKIDEVLDPLRAKPKPKTNLEKWVQDNLDIKKVSAGLQSDVSKLLTPRYKALAEAQSQLDKNKEQLAQGLKQIFEANPNYKIHNTTLGELSSGITKDNVLMTILETRADYKSGKINPYLEQFISQNKALENYVLSAKEFSDLNRNLLIQLGTPLDRLYAENFVYVPHIKNFNERGLQDILTARKYPTLIQGQQAGFQFLTDPLSTYYSLQGDMTNVFSRWQISQNISNITAYSSDSLLAYSPQLQKTMAQFTTLEELPVSASNALFRSAVSQCFEINPAFFENSQVKAIMEQFENISSLPTSIQKQNQINSLYTDLIKLAPDEAKIGLIESRETICDVLNTDIENNLIKIATLTLEDSPEALKAFSGYSPTFQEQLGLIITTNNRELSRFKISPEQYIKSITLSGDTYVPRKNNVFNNAYDYFEFSNLNPKGVELHSKSAINLFNTTLYSKIPELRSLVPKDHLFSKAYDMFYQVNRLIKSWQLQTPSFYFNSNVISNAFMKYISCGTELYDSKFNQSAHKIADTLFDYTQSLEDPNSKTFAVNLIESLTKKHKLSREETEVFNQMLGLDLLANKQWNEYFYSDEVNQIAKSFDLDLSQPIKDKKKFAEFTDFLTKDRTGVFAMAQKSDLLNQSTIYLSNYRRGGASFAKQETEKLFRSLDSFPLPFQFLAKNVTNFIHYKTSSFLYTGQNLLQNPQFLQKAVRFENYVQGLQDGEIREAKAQLPTDDYRKNPFWIGSGELYLGITANPLSEFMTTSRMYLMTEGPSQMLQEWSSSLNVPLSLAYGLATQTDNFTGRPIVSDNPYDYSYRQIPQFMGRALSVLPDWIKEKLEFTETSYKTQSGAVKEKFSMNPWVSYLIQRYGLNSAITRLGAIKDETSLARFLSGLDISGKTQIINSMALTTDNEIKQELYTLLVQSGQVFWNPDIYLNDSQRQNFELPYSIDNDIDNVLPKLESLPELKKIIR